MENNVVGISPKPREPKSDNSKQMDFPEAIRQIIDGNKVTKLEWDDNKYYGVLKDGFLMLHKPDDEFYKWLVSDGDLEGTDWVILS